MKPYYHVISLFNGTVPTGGTIFTYNPLGRLLHAKKGPSCTAAPKAYIETNNQPPLKNEYKFLLLGQTLKFEEYNIFTFVES